MGNQQGNFIIIVFGIFGENYISLQMQERIKELRDKGFSINKIAKECNIANYRVRKFLVELNLDLKTPKEGGGRKRKYHIDDKFFESIDTEEKAYILGFIYADGCVHKDKNQVSITLKRDDTKILEKIGNVMKSTFPLYFSKSRYSLNYRLTDKVRLIFTSRKIVDDLETIGCKERKGDTLVFPIISQELVKHFIRGYFDGDGTVYRTGKGDYLHFGIISTKEFCSKYLDYLPIERVTIIKEKRTTKNVYYFTVAKKKQVEKLYDYLYQDSTIFLERKFQIFQKYYNRRPSTTIIETPEMVMV